MDSEIEKKEKNKFREVVKSPLFVLLALIAFAGVASAYQYGGMDNLSDFIDDMVLIIPKLIGLVIPIIIISIVFVFRDFFIKLFKSFTQ